MTSRFSWVSLTVVTDFERNAQLRSQIPGADYAWQADLLCLRSTRYSIHGPAKLSNCIKAAVKAAL